MSDRMIPIPFENLITRLFTEYKKSGTVYGVHKKYVAPAGRELTIFGERLETPFGPAAGPNTQRSPASLRRMSATTASGPPS